MKLKEIKVYNNGQKIYGVAFIPNRKEKKYPLVICSHGLGGSYKSCFAYAEQLAMKGIAAYCFDFRGGGGTNSEGDTTQMSVMTEVSDIETIIETAKNWDFVDQNKIVLFGNSHGGLASAIVAAKHLDKVAGLILFYPAFLVTDIIHTYYSSLEEVPESFFFYWITLGRLYIADIWDFDIYETIGKYNKKVLLLHGDADTIVPISYSEKALEVYTDVDFHIINGAGHGFKEEEFDEALDHIFVYLEKIEILPKSKN